MIIFLIHKNFGNNFPVQAGATVVAGGPGAAMMREKMFASQEEEAGTQDLVTTDDGSTQGTDVDGSNHFGFEAWALKPTEERMKFSIETMPPLQAQLFWLWSGESICLCLPVVEEWR